MLRGTFTVLFGPPVTILGVLKLLRTNRGLGRDFKYLVLPSAD